MLKHCGCVIRYLNTVLYYVDMLFFLSQMIVFFGCKGEREKFLVQA